MGILLLQKRAVRQSTIEQIKFSQRENFPLEKEIYGQVSKQLKLAYTKYEGKEFFVRKNEGFHHV